MPTRLSRLAFLSLLALSAAACSACGKNTAVCKLTGPINDPSNRAQRRDILEKGLGEFCAQMMAHNAPLKMNEDSPIIGRFYVRSCRQQILDNGDFSIGFEGEGYAWTQMSKKVTFTSSGSVRYNQDFRCSEDNAIYAYFPIRQGGVTNTAFNVRQIEQPLANMLQSFVGPYAENFGKQMVSGKLGEGFTVIYDGDNADVGLGIIPLGQRPFHPYNVHGSSRILYESQRTEVQPTQRDFIGPIEIKEKGRALFLKMELAGSAPVDLFVMRRDEAEGSLRLYLDYPASGPLATPPTWNETLAPGMQYGRTVPLSPGVYYVVIDNTASAGTVAPPDDRAAVVSYLIQIGDNP